MQNKTAVLFLTHSLPASEDGIDEASRDPVATEGALMEVFDETLPDGAQWQATSPEAIVRAGGADAGERYAYMRTPENRTCPGIPRL